MRIQQLAESASVRGQDRPDRHPGQDTYSSRRSRTHAGEGQTGWAEEKDSKTNTTIAQMLAMTVCARASMQLNN